MVPELLVPRHQIKVYMSTIIGLPLPYLVYHQGNSEFKIQATREELMEKSIYSPIGRNLETIEELHLA